MWLKYIFVGVRHGIQIITISQTQKLAISLELKIKTKAKTKQDKCIKQTFLRKHSR